MEDFENQDEEFRLEATRELLRFLEQENGMMKAVLQEDFPKAVCKIYWETVKGDQLGICHGKPGVKQ